ncbi:Guanine nucleotide-binding protein alpha-13 subunit [Caenorhabditis elegans]|uniref:Guanine nucleotide-binding protein alpha-13 subunit n=1 Tax=Caenorhabditis elegans TaxID=6239 RepID=G5EC80_CAEEL|nr:G-protein alpha subunit [Caenorhabditis elegans]CCA65551.1 G-protein alpha subunit [Caenorhabditis elegans]|eukprot:NP_001256451.1 Guanine nucleotide-binding protein alpha-13 subunit [Caenorhabditis elegans]
MGCNFSSQSKVSDVPAACDKPIPEPDVIGKEENIEPIEHSAEKEVVEKKESTPVPPPSISPQVALQVPEIRASRSITPASQKSEDPYSHIRLLLLGSAESGKTTVLEQVRLLYKQHFTESEYFHRRAFIYHNIFKSIKALCRAMRMSDIQFADPINMGRAQSIIADEHGHYGLFSKDLAEKIKHIWNDKSMQKLYARRSQFNLNDSASYFLNNIDKINMVDYKPSERDLIMAYVPTCGVQNVIFTACNQSFQLFDIGGQKIDRRKWALQYEGIDAIFFCIAISEYDQVMSEDMVTNRLDDALNLLQSISEDPAFATTPIYLFLNEIDVFCEKLSVIPLSKYKPDFKGGDQDDAIDFMENLACEALGKRDRSLYRVYRCIAIDTQMMAELLSTVFKDIAKRKK